MMLEVLGVGIVVDDGRCGYSSGTQEGNCEGDCGMHGV